MLRTAEMLFRKHNPDYADFRRQDISSTAISLRDSETSVSSGSRSGISFRVLLRGSWGFASTNDFSRIEDVFRKALRMAALSPGKSRVPPSRPVSGKAETSVKLSPEDVDVGKKMRDMRELQSSLSGNSVSSRTVTYSDFVSTNVFLNSEGSRIQQRLSKVRVSMTALAKSGNIMERASERVGRSAGYETVDEAFSLVEQCPKRARALLSASPAPSGKHRVVVDGRMTGLLCHEALGHACEADSIISGESILKNSMRKKIASPLVTITDDPTLKGAFGSYSFDDEGVGASRTTLVERGRLVSFLHSRETAAKLGAKPTGNARSEGSSFPPIVRMSNTCMQGGDAEVEELFEGLGLGVYARGMSGGCVDTTTGYFVFGAEEGFLIERGRRTALLRDILLSGNVLDSLKGVEMVAKDFSGSPGTCGKMGQEIPVSDGGPHVRMSGILVGGQGK